VVIPNKKGKDNMSNPDADQLMQLFNNVGKMTISYTNGSTLSLEGEALTNFVNFQKSLIFLYTTFASASTAAKAATPEEKPQQPNQPLTRTTLADQLNRNKKGQS
jgi:hypothetical protein